MNLTKIPLSLETLCFKAFITNNFILVGSFLKVFFFLFFLLNFKAYCSVFPGDLSYKIDKVVKKYHNEACFHGNVKIIKGNKTLFEKSVGIANEAFDVPHSKKSRFMIASISKQFTAVAILILVDEGLLKLDERFSSYISFKGILKENLEPFSKITIRQLLSHQSNLIRDVIETDYYTNERYAPYLPLITKKLFSEKELFKENKTGSGLYSNLGYLLLAQLVEKVSDSEFHEFLQEKIFKPLNMNSTGQFHRMFNIKYMADGYFYPSSENEHIQKRCCLDATSFVGSHSLYSDVEDLEKWLNFLSEPDKFPLLSKESFLELFKVQTPVMNESNPSYGLGFFIDDFGGYKRIWHDGVEEGFLSLISYLPELDIKIIILGNRHDELVYQNDLYTRKMQEEILEILQAPES